MFKEQFKSLKRYRVKRNVLEGKSFELFRDNNWIKARR